MKLSLQKFSPYDKSIKWNIHRNFFLKTGADAWLNGEVPYNITSNSYAAYQIACLLYQTIKNMENNELLKEDEKINVMELASGVGLFAINFVKQFEKICVYNKVNYFERFQYFLSDFSEKNLQDATKNKYLRDMQKSGHIVFVVVNALNPTKIKPLENDEFITDIKFTSIIANYTHDNLPLTILQKNENLFYEKHIALSIETDEMARDKIDEYKKELVDNPINMVIMNKLIEEEKYVKIDQTAFNADHKEVINEATKNFSLATIIYPYGSFQAIKEATPLLKKGGFYIISDKGYANEYYMKGDKSSAPSIHGNSFAHSVNFPLIEIYAQKLGLFTSRTSNPEYTLQTLIITTDDNKLIKEEFNKLFIANNFNDDASELERIAESLISDKKFHDAIVVLKQVLKILQYDANIYYRIGYLLLNEPNKAAEAIMYLTNGGKYNYFNVYNFEFELGVAYYSLGEFKKSINYYKTSLNLFGESKYIFHNIGLCYIELKDYKSAKKYLLKALKIDNQYEPARNDLNDIFLKLEPLYK